MTLDIANVWVPSPTEWDDVWECCPYSTFFHSREWAEIWSEYRSGRFSPTPIYMALSDGTEILLPFSKEKMGMGIVERYLSSATGTFGGWLAKEPLATEQQAVLLEFVAKHYTNLIWRENPYERVLLTEHFSRTVHDETQALDISVGFDEIYRGWSKGHSSAARKARKVGVQVRLAETKSDWEKYFQVYENSYRRWGESARVFYSWSLFQILFLRASSNIKLWLAEHDGRVIAGAICFYSPRHVVYWHGAALSDSFELRPVNLLMFEVIQDAVDQGARWFDFNPSGDLVGVRDFKKNFGAKSLPATIFYKETAILKGLQKLGALH